MDLKRRQVKCTMLDVWGDSTEKAVLIANDKERVNPRE